MKRALLLRRDSILDGWSVVFDAPVVAETTSMVKVRIEAGKTLFTRTQLYDFFWWPRNSNYRRVEEIKEGDV